MINFKEIAEKCLAGELSGRFVCRDGLHISSFTLSRTNTPAYPYKLYRVGKLTIDGHTPNKYSQNDIIKFIPYEEMKKEQIKIDIPEGMEAVQEIVDGEIRIAFVDKKITYITIKNELQNKYKFIDYVNIPEPNDNEALFVRKMNVIRELINIRNYFGKPKHDTYGHALYYTIERGIHTTPALYPSNDQRVIFDTKEHAEQAIKMLGDELKYLFEPW